MEPSEFHKLIPRFRWFAIITTNYDLVLEKTYELDNHKLQKIAPIISDDDQFSKIISDPYAVPYLKFTWINNSSK